MQWDHTHRVLEWDGNLCRILIFILKQFDGCNLVITKGQLTQRTFIHITVSYPNQLAQLFRPGFMLQFVKLVYFLHQLESTRRGKIDLIHIICSAATDSQMRIVLKQTQQCNYSNSFAQLFYSLFHPITKQLFAFFFLCHIIIAKDCVSFIFKRWQIPPRT